MENQDVIYGINGPVVTVKNSRSFSTVSYTHLTLPTIYSV